MPNMQTIKRKRVMNEVANTIPKHILKSLDKRLTQLSGNECITVTIQTEVEVSCIWDEGDEPTLQFCEQTESPEDMLEDASDDELKELGLSSITELRERIQKEITEWNDEIKRLEKAYSLEKDLLLDFCLEGYYGSE